MNKTPPKTYNYFNYTFTKKHQGMQNQTSNFNKYPSSVPLLGWTKDEAEVVRNQLSSFLEDWNDPSMDIYNTL